MKPFIAYCAGICTMILALSFGVNLFFLGVLPGSDYIFIKKNPKSILIEITPQIECQPEPDFQVPKTQTKTRDKVA